MKKKIFKFAFIGVTAISFFYSAFCNASVNDSAVKTPWGYQGDIGPEHWGQLNTNFLFCAQGRKQSPIDISKVSTHKPHQLVLNYHPASASIVDDGTTELNIEDTPTLISDGHGIQLNFSKDTNETISFAGEKYQLVQFHTHTPSENHLDGKSYPLEIHFVHQGEHGKIAVIGVFFKLGKNNPILQKIIDNFPADEGIVHPIPNQMINPIELIPSSHDYFSFDGSLTTPPCAEGVQWIVMKTPLEASAEQIEKFVGKEGMNARNIQPLNGRDVKFSKNHN